MKEMFNNHFNKKRVIFPFKIKDNKNNNSKKNHNHRRVLKG